MAETWQEGGFGLYVHWPFCQAKCPYCDFNSHVVSHVDQQRWSRALASEIARSAEETGPRVLRSIFFGGGTPSLMAPETVDQVIRSAREAWPFANDIEITLEANPTSVEAGRFQGYRDAGVNRVSLGVQALNDTDLKRLGRLHSAQEARAAFDIARAVFDRVSFDLIYARQDQSAADWEVELTEALSMAVDHLSLYQLTIEDGTAFGDRYRKGGLRGLPTEDIAADLWDVTQTLCGEAGFPAYEISNHARPGAESNHNLIYWRGGDYVGVGPGAHGRLTLSGGRVATEAERLPGAWIDKVERLGNGEVERDRLSRETQLDELLLMGLRVSEGVSVKRLEDLSFSVSGTKALVEEGWLEIEGGRLRVSTAGRPLLNAVLRRLLA
ncbi:radical SAM family heme chaperone HemW [Histidinibacterium aquaticum]|uniref:Heme chaperone HemW n=1 Tax=Histidinibacterium aquaticum TaxID=2613962 RepID=A0A5J5GFE1_9RHOB|nr:radical SAM family heme chaperone HemW [Histidinibacterium aquaticum]KAA9006831.1 coproporphyrinogen III oxidase [Histidinibacterium aquaticum]